MLSHKGVATIAVVGMAATALIEASLVYLLEPLMDEALVCLRERAGGKVISHEQLPPPAHLVREGLSVAFWVITRS